MRRRWGAPTRRRNSRLPRFRAARGHPGSFASPRPGLLGRQEGPAASPLLPALRPRGPGSRRRAEGCRAGDGRCPAEPSGLMPGRPPPAVAARPGGHNGLYLGSRRSPAREREFGIRVVRWRGPELIKTLRPLADGLLDTVIRSGDNIRCGRTGAVISFSPCMHRRSPSECERGGRLRGKRQLFCRIRSARRRRVAACCL